MDLKISTIKAYMSGIRFQQGSLGLRWMLEGNEMVRRCMRYISKRYGSEAKSRKLPITVDLLKKALSQVQGWPDLASMSHDDRVFATASVIAILGFLRGGEFLASPRSVRPVLRAEDVSVVSVGRSEAVQVNVVQPKARWWLNSVPVLCYSPLKSSTLDPVWLLKGMRQLAPRHLPRSPAFVLADGAVLSRQHMVTRMQGLLEEAGVQFPTLLGSSLRVQAASWRAGGACSAVRAGVSDAVIKQMGRWASSAWLSYARATTSEEMLAATASIVKLRSVGVLSARLGEEAFRGSSFEEAEVVPEVQAQVRASVHRRAATEISLQRASIHRRAVG
jgi:hypothetical protein